MEARTFNAFTYSNLSMVYFLKRTSITRRITMFLITFLVITARFKVFRLKPTIFTVTTVLNFFCTRITTFTGIRTTRFTIYILKILDSSFPVKMTTINQVTCECGQTFEEFKIFNVYLSSHFTKGK